MTRSTRIRANRQNAQASTGPKSANGKAIVARNAIRHGLTMPILCEPSVAAVIEPLAKKIAGSQEAKLIQARRIALSQLEIDRARTARNTAYQAIEDSLGATLNSVADAKDTEAAAGRLIDLVQKLIALDRYEQRALARRKQLIRELSHIASELG